MNSSLLHDRDTCWVRGKKTTALSGELKPRAEVVGGRGGGLRGSDWVSLLREIYRNNDTRWGNKHTSKGIPFAVHKFKKKKKNAINIHISAAFRRRETSGVKSGSSGGTVDRDLIAVLMKEVHKVL